MPVADTAAQNLEGAQNLQINSGYADVVRVAYLGVDRNGRTAGLIAGVAHWTLASGFDKRHLYHSGVPLSEVSVPAP